MHFFHGCSPSRLLDLFCGRPQCDYMLYCIKLDDSGLFFLFVLLNVNMQTILIISHSFTHKADLQMDFYQSKRPIFAIGQVVRM